MLLGVGRKGVDEPPVAPHQLAEAEQDERGESGVRTVAPSRRHRLDLVHRVGTIVLADRLAPTAEGLEEQARCGGLARWRIGRFPSDLPELGKGGGPGCGGLPIAQQLAAVGGCAQGAAQQLLAHDRGQPSRSWQGSPESQLLGEAADLEEAQAQVRAPGGQAALQVAGQAPGGAHEPDRAQRAGAELGQGREESVLQTVRLRMANDMPRHTWECSAGRSSGRNRRAPAPKLASQPPARRNMNQNAWIVGFAALGLTSLAAAFAVQEPAAVDAGETKIIVLTPEKEPYWDSVIVESDRSTKLVEVEEGRRFVLTDLWTMAHEEYRDQLPSGSDRLWLEASMRGKRRVVFDALLRELPHSYDTRNGENGATAYAIFEPQPIRWETGVKFASGSEAWINYRFDGEAKSNHMRRVFFSGYFEDAEPR